MLGRIKVRATVRVKVYLLLLVKFVSTKLLSCITVMSQVAYDYE